MKKTKKRECSSNKKTEFIELKNPWNSDYNCFVRVSDIVALIPQDDFQLQNTPSPVMPGRQLQANSGVTVTVNSSNPMTRYTSVKLMGWGIDLPDSRTPKEIMAILTSKAGKILYG